MRITTTAPPWPQIKVLYREAPWAAAWLPARLKRAIRNSRCLWAMEGSTLIGVVRVVTDGATVTYICDLVVKESCRHRGVGTKLMRALMQGERTRCTSFVVLTVEAEPFYLSLGFEQRAGMLRRHR